MGRALFVFILDSRLAWQRSLLNNTNLAVQDRTARQPYPKVPFPRAKMSCRLLFFNLELGGVAILQLTWSLHF